MEEDKTNYVEIIFHTSSTPKKMDDVYAVYTKDGLLCIQHNNGLIMKYPLCNVFSVAQWHKNHAGTTRDKK